LSYGHIVVRLLRIEEKISAIWANRIIVTQNDSKKLLTNMGIKDSKISVVLNVPDEDVFMSEPVTVKDNGSFVLITHGSIVERYNIQSLIRTVPLLVNDIPKLKVEVVGGGEYKEQLELLAEDLGVKEYVNFTGLLPFEEVCSHIARAHVGVAVIPSGANPAVPNKLFEYLAMRKPAIVTTVPTIEEYFDNETVMYYEPDNESDLARCILELYRNPEKRAALAATGLAAYQKYHWPVMKYEYLRVFDEMTGGSESSVSGQNGED
jgi:glycosyltransferase involved in cell wall biosynthesis